MEVTQPFYYEAVESEPLSMEVVTAVAQAHDEDVIDQRWVIGEDIDTDALDGLFQQYNLNMTLQFEADSSTVTINANGRGTPMIRVESHR